MYLIEGIILKIKLLDMGFGNIIFKKIVPSLLTIIKYQKYRHIDVYKYKTRELFSIYFLNLFLLVLFRKLSLLFSTSIQIL